MNRICTQCSAAFDILPMEQTLLEKCSPEFAGKKEILPPPVECPDCRRQRRLMFRNFFHLYHRTCDLTGKKIISMYDKDAPFPVYEMHEWWSDQWDGFSYGLDVNLSKSFFDQLHKLHVSVPRMSMMNTQCENTDYCNMSVWSRNCYLVFGNVRNEDCAYGHIVWQSQNCYDCLYVYRSAFCYEAVDCVQCHSLAFSRDCDNCASSMFLVHCVGCRDCFGCVGLKSKQYHIFNEPHTKADYERKMAELNTGNINTMRMAKEHVQELVAKEIVKEYHGFNCENVTGDYLYNCKNIHEGYDLKNCEDCVYCATLESFRDCMDCNFCPAKSECCYQCLAVDGYRLLSCHNCLNGCVNLSYCDKCYACKDCFGCAGLKSRQYCIFNKQYTRKEYERLVPTIIEHMRKTPLRSPDGSSAGQAGEYGQFFPRDFSPFGYNETIAQEYFPLTKEDARLRKWQWKKENEKAQNYLGPIVEVPEDIAEASDDIIQKILRCEVTGKLYKIIPQELQFYRDMRLPPPHMCFEQRQRERFALRNPRRLWNRECAKCSKPIQTTYAPDRSEKVYCENCYLQTVY